MKLTKKQIEERTALKKRKKEIKEAIRRRNYYLDIMDLTTTLGFFIGRRKLGLGTLRQLYRHIKWAAQVFPVAGIEMTKEEIKFMTKKESPCVTYDRKLP